MISSVSALPLVIVVATCCVTQIAASVAQSANITKSPQFGICEQEAPRSAGMKPTRIGGRVRPPKKVRDVPPKYPEQPAQTVGSGMWVAEALIDAKGKISHVWTIREVSFKPPFPEFNQSIVEAIRQWEFEPTIIGNAATPVCMVVTMNINWR
jgi:outer membrane biosynthesis protein TonB